MASCSKQFTGAAIVLLKRESKINYNDKIVEYLPELSFWNNVTIQDLLKHTSGLPEYTSNMGINCNKRKIYTNTDLLHFYTSRKDTLAFTPGSVHEYNNTNYALLAIIIERVSGKSYGQYLSENIFTPLRMSNTFVYSRRLKPRKLKNFATGYVWAKNSFDKVTPDDARYGEDMVYCLDGIVGSAKVNSTVEDLFIWIKALKENKLLSQNEFDEMTRVTQTSSGKSIPYGYGLDISKSENKFAFGHTGGWDGYDTFIYHDALKDRTIITLQNFQMGASLFYNITEILNNQPLTTEYRRKITLTEGEIKRYTGEYRDEKSNEIHVITYLNGHLVYNTTKKPWDMRFFPATANEFQAVRIGGTDGLLRFTKLGNGDFKIEMLQYGQIIGSGIKSVKN